MSCVEDSVMGSAMKSKRSTLASAALVGLSGCLTVNNIPTKDEPAPLPDGSATMPDAAHADSSASGAIDGGGVQDAGGFEFEGGAGDAAPPPPQPCENLPDVDYNGIPLKGAKDYCAPGLVCNAARLCVPIEPCSATSPAACSLDELAGEAFDDPSNGLSFRPSLVMDDTYVYFTRFGTYGPLNEYNEDGSILRAKIGVWEPEVIHEGIPAPEGLTISGDSLFFVSRSKGDYFHNWADKVGVLPWRALARTTGHVYSYAIAGDLIVYVEEVPSSEQWGAASFAVRAMRTNGELLPDFGGEQLFARWPELSAGAEEGVFARTESGHFRLDLDTGALIRLDSYVADIDWFSGQYWVALQGNTWLTRRGVDELEPTRIGGIGGRVYQALTSPGLAFLYAYSKTLVPRVARRVLVAASLTGTPTQQLMDPYVSDPDCYSTGPAAASDRGVILSSLFLENAGCVGDPLSHHYVFRPL